MNDDFMFTEDDDRVPPPEMTGNLGKPSPQPGDPGPWLVLVVDDEPEVHAVTRLALARLQYKNRRVRILSAASAQEAVELLSGHPDIAVALLDVVMETGDAGLQLVRTIREALGNHAIRIILRTGQPGQAPEEDVILGYDINDYKSKTELTAQKLFTSVISALRAYADIVALEANRRGLQQIIRSTDSLFELRSMQQFAAGVLTQLSTFLRVKPDAILYAQKCPPANGPAGGAPPGAAGAGDTLYVLAAAGRYAEAGEPHSVAVPSALSPRIRECIAETFRLRHSVYGPDGTTLYIRVPDGNEVVAWLHTDRPLDEVDRSLVEVFASKIAISFVNVSLYERLREANETLEARVAERTRALEEANAQLKRLATLDPLTGAWNRRRFLELARAELGRARRSGQPLSVCLLDLDRFKGINDTYGHAAGDDVLRVVVDRMRAALRTSDQVARFGGEEFVVLLPETDPDSAVAVAERVRQAIAGLPVDCDDRAVPVTASIGVASWQSGDESIESTLRRADAALYEAKQKGRNRVCQAGRQP